MGSLPWFFILLVLPSAFAADPDPAFKPFKFRSIGPAWGGRVSRAAGIAGDTSTYYAATASGGVWKSTDGGFNWKSVFDDQPTASIGSIALAPSNPNVVYVGSGEANIRGNVAPGLGIFKSTDAGKTWQHVWKQEGQIGTMAVHPTNPDIAYAAVLGKAFSSNPERGVYRTRDGGKTWEQVLKKDENTGASDVALDPNNPNIVFAGLWQARRTPWDLTSGGPGSGLYVSRDGGDTWKQLTEKDGLPKGIWGKVGVAVAPSDSQRVYALIEAEEGGLFRSDDGGGKWRLVSADRNIRQRPWYYMTLTVHPANANELWAPSVPMMKSIDGGLVWKHVRGFAHGDHHDLWIDPKNPKRMINANDGGVEISHDGGATWFQPALPIGQVYHVGIDTREPFHVGVSLQDIGTAQGPSDGLHANGIGNSEWYRVGGGEAGHVVSDPSDPNIVYAGEYGGIITHYDHRTRQARNVSTYPENPSGHGGEDLEYRFQWTAPIHISPHDPKTVYHGSNVIHRTRDGGQTWDVISPDLTRNDKSKQKWSGGPITGDNTGVEIYCTVFAIAESPKEKGLIWAGSDDGLVHLTRDAGKTWTKLALPGVPDFATVSMIEPSPFDAAAAYIVFDNHRQGDNRPYLFATRDYGKTWERLDGALPQDDYLHAVREDPVAKGLLYIGAEHGLSLSRDNGKSWTPFRLNLPTVAVHDIAVRGNSLVLGTHGRSVWIYDHLNAVREWSAEIKQKPSHLFSVAPVTAWRRDRRAADRFMGENPSAGAAILYWLKEAPKSDLSLEILDAQGKLVRRYSSKPREPWGSYDNPEAEAERLKKEALPKEPGVQLAVWDLRHEGATPIRNAKVDMGEPTEGPFALAGIYTARLTVDGQTHEQRFEVKPDPRVTVPEEALREQLTHTLGIRDAITRLGDRVRSLQQVRKQLKDRNALLESNPKAANLRQASAALVGKLDALEEQFHNPKAEVSYDILAFRGGTRLYSRMIWTYVNSIGEDGAPTQGSRKVSAAQREELAKLERELNRLLDSDLGTLNVEARKLELPVVIVP